MREIISKLKEIIGKMIGQEVLIEIRDQLKADAIVRADLLASSKRIEGLLNPIVDITDSTTPPTPRE